MKNLFFVLMVIALVSCEKKTSSSGSAIKIVTENNNGLKYEYEFDTIKKVKQGYHKTFYPNGKIQREMNYVNDTAQGLEKEYYESGKISGEFKRVNGLYSGEFKNYYESGKLKQLGQYVDNVLSGELKSYYENGTLKESITMGDNVEKGPFTEYHDNGKIKTKGEFLGGKDTEICKLEKYNKEGKLDTTMICNGKAGCITVWTAEKGDIKVTNSVGIAIVEEMKGKCEK